MKVSIQYARDHFDELLLATDNGEEVEVSREGKPSIKLFVVPSALRMGNAERKLGAGRGTFLPSMDDQWQQVKEEEARVISDTPLMPIGEI